jgi:uroporphyrinogen-III synthase
MRALITRPEIDGRLTAQKLSDHGVDCVLLPLSRLIPIQAKKPGIPFSAVLATSANAFLGLKAQDWALEPSVPVWVVGEKTAQAARNAGFHDVYVAHEPHAHALVQDVLRAFSSLEATFIYLAAEESSSVLLDGLQKKGHKVILGTVYRAEAISYDNQTAIADHLASPIDVVLHYSSRAVRLYAQLVGAHGKGAACSRHICLSASVAQCVRELGLGQAFVAADAHDEAMIAQTIKIFSSLQGQS